MATADAILIGRLRRIEGGDTAPPEAQPMPPGDRYLHEQLLLAEAQEQFGTIPKEAAPPPLLDPDLATIADPVLAAKARRLMALAPHWRELCVRADAAGIGAKALLAVLRDGPGTTRARQEFEIFHATDSRRRATARKLARYIRRKLPAVHALEPELIDRLGSGISMPALRERKPKPEPLTPSCDTPPKDDSSKFPSWALIIIALVLMRACNAAINHS